VVVVDHPVAALRGDGKMKMKIDSPKIEKAIDDFENHVDCELIPVITRHSSYVEHIAWVISLLLLILFIGIIDLLFQDSWQSKTVYYATAPVLAIILGFLLDKSDLVDRFFISKKERERQVWEKAQRIFLLKRNEAHKSRQALLLFVSLMERRIVIFPDPGMQLPGLDALQSKMLKIIQADFKNGRYEQGFLDAIQFLKTELATKYPQTQQSSQNHYANKLIWWDV